MAAVSSVVDKLVEKLHLLRCSSVESGSTSEQQVYITHMTVGQETNVLTTGETSGSVRIHNLDDLRPLGTIKQSKKPVTGLSVSRANEKLLWTTNAEDKMNCWDLRKDMKTPIFTLTSPNGACYTTCDINCSGDMVAAATEPSDDDVCIYVWDIRLPGSSQTGSNVFLSITDSHKDDITQVKFHPSKSKQLASCSTDGLVCLFDVSSAEEDDALQWVLNSQSSVARIGYYGEHNEKLYCITHVETLQLWDTEQGSLPVDYLIDCMYLPDRNKLHLLSGTHSGQLKIFDVQRDGIMSSGLSSEGHRATVRCLDYHVKSRRIITSGEDSNICQWEVPTDSQVISPHFVEKEEVTGVRKTTQETSSRPRAKPYERPLASDKSRKRYK
ncbi:WD repeat-containing protein 89 isoform X2 [Nematostella vectensis]|uniref:WD repeat-containing protein 89 isoform X2 n=1 Tax=Nematostella vectensis TaxID=45351 RepID=UPI00138FB3EF|nr:WD repeat-containing protein 89 isoform X2 [Nematostella vectensis]